MMNLLRWTATRLWCTVTGHAPYQRARFYYPPASSVVLGWRCPSCGKRKLLLAPWDHVDDNEGEA